MSRYKKSKLPKQSRTIRLPGNKDRGSRSAGGTGEDFRKYYRCWHCGFVCNEDRDSLGGISSGDGITFVEFAGSVGSGYLSLGALNNKFIVISNRTPDVKRNFKPVVDSGCPLCGSLNWRGDYM
jgi:hypothetical protein